MKKILILTHVKDDCASLVVKRLIELNADFVRFDTEKFPQEVKINLETTKCGKIIGVIVFPNLELPIDEIGCVWNRRPHDPEISPDLKEEQYRKWAQEESSYALSNLYSLIDCPWVNSRTSDALIRHNKWLEMKVAAQLGLTVPYSLMSNSEPSIVSFWNQINHSMAMKKIGAGRFTNIKGNACLFHTVKIPASHMTKNDLKRMRFAPVFLQEYIDKLFELRCVIIGNQVFSFTIHSQEHSASKIDWRNIFLFEGAEGLKHLRHKVYKLPVEIEDKLVQFNNFFGFRFGVVDMIVTPNKEFVFLENNSNGQWAWLEFETGQKISRVLAKYLVECAKKS